MRVFNEVDSKLILGDCVQVMDELPAYAFSLIVTDPPYLFTKHQGKLQPSAEGKKRLNSSPLYDYSDNTGRCLIKDGNGREQTFRWLDMTPRLMRKYNAYVFCSDEQIAYYQEWAEIHGYLSSVLVWEKPVEIISKKRWSQNVEFIVRIYERGTGLKSVDNSQLYGRVFHYKRIRNKLHPTEKPVEMLQRIIMLSSNDGDSVLDPFCGSASTYVAATRLGRKCVAIEKNKMFYDIAKKRIDNEEPMLNLK